MKRIRGVVSVTLGVAALSCTEPTTSGPDAITPTPPAGIVVSNAVAANGRSLFAAASSFTAFVSAAPGTFPSGVSVSIRNVTLNSTVVTAPIVNGGFDPVGISAEADDGLSLEITNADHTTITVSVKVPPRRLPRVVRTTPSNGRTDVALNVQIEVIFTEPMDRSTITTSSVSLLRDGQAVSGSLVISADGLSTTFIPNSPLDRKETYTLVIGAGIHDLDGDTLGEQSTVQFTTADADLPVESPAKEVSGIAFVRNGAIFVSGSSTTEPVALVGEALRPSWSPDGSQIAFTRPAGNVLSNWKLCITGRDGSNIRCATGQTNGSVVGGPSWSPDGSKVAFSVFTNDCPNGQCGQLGGYFSSVLLLDTRTLQVESLNTPPAWRAVSWSPDNRKIAFTIWGTGTFGRGALATVNVDGSGLNILAMSLATYSVEGIAWSPDAAKLALTLRDEFACPWYCDTAVGVVNADGTSLRVFDRAHTCFDSSSCRADEAYIWGAPAWSPDGARVAYTVTRGGECYIDDRVTCGTDIASVTLADGRVEILLPAAGFPSWR